MYVNAGCLVHITRHARQFSKLHQKRSSHPHSRAFWQRKSELRIHRAVQRQAPYLNDVKGLARAQRGELPPCMRVEDLHEGEPAVEHLLELLRREGGHKARILAARVELIHAHPLSHLFCGVVLDCGSKLAACTQTCLKLL